MDRARLRHHLPSGPFVAIAAAAVLLFGALLVYFGAYDIAADAPHTRPVYALLDNLRDRSIAVRARDIVAPADLNAPTRISAGAGLYAEMCSSCHLGPGVERSELSQGLYPQAPELAKGQDLSAAEQFWIIKHGVKLSAMPAWGKTHPDPLIWDMVAFVRRLPGMTPDQYRRLVASAPGDHDEMMKDMPGMK
jgi:mono/diheme cytochrome c family protein